MTPPLELDYIGLSEASAAAGAGGGCGCGGGGGEEEGAGREPVDLRKTELRLGLPGSESPDRPGLALGLPRCFAAGAKRGFADTMDGSRKWVFSGKGGSEGELVKGGGGGGLFSPRRESGGDVGGPAKPAAGQEKKSGEAPNSAGLPRAAKAQVVGWPPIRSYRKNTMASNTSKSKEDSEEKQNLGCLYVKVSMDGAPYLRKVDLKTYSNYKELSSALEKMFSCFTIGQCGSHGLPTREGLSESRMMDLLQGSEYVLTYEDKDGDWMLVGDVPWNMFIDSCRRLRIMKGSDAIGIAPRAMEKCKSRN